MVVNYSVIELILNLLVLLFAGGAVAKKFNMNKLGNGLIGSGVILIKGGTSKIIRDEFPELARIPSLWTRSYFVSTAGMVSKDTIKKYVESQKQHH